MERKSIEKRYKLRDNMWTFVLILLQSDKIWWLNLNLSSNKTPRIFVLSTNGMEILPSDKLRSLLSIYNGLDLILAKLNKIAWVFAQLIIRRLWANQLEIRSKSTLSESVRFLMLLDEAETVESSAKRSRNDWRLKWHKSLIKIIKKREPKTRLELQHSMLPLWI